MSTPLRTSVPASHGHRPLCPLPSQASTVVELVVGLLNAGAGVRPDDIGVMATYRKQVAADVPFGLVCRLGVQAGVVPCFRYLTGEML